MTIDNAITIYALNYAHIQLHPFCLEFSALNRLKRPTKFHEEKNVLFEKKWNL